LYDAVYGDAGVWQMINGYLWKRVTRVNEFAEMRKKELSKQTGKMEMKKKQTKRTATLDWEQ
jgi:hypothetical protein